MNARSTKRKFEMFKQVWLMERMVASGGTEMGFVIRSSRVQAA